MPQVPDQSLYSGWPTEMLPVVRLWLRASPMNGAPSH